MIAARPALLDLPPPPRTLGLNLFLIRSFANHAAHHQWAAWLRGVLAAAKRSRIRRPATTGIRPRPTPFAPA